MNSKAKGNRQEHRTMRVLERAGYACTRSSASLGKFDIVGISATDVVLVQVKSNRWPPREEMEALQSFSCPPNARKLIHRWRDGEKLPDVKEVS